MYIPSSLLVRALPCLLLFFLSHPLPLFIIAVVAVVQQRASSFMRVL